MSAEGMAAAAARGRPVARQVLEVMWWELRRSLSWRSLWLFVVALVPLAIITGHIVDDHQHHLQEHTVVLAAIIQIFYVRFGIFFGCLGVFMRLIRGEIAERTLHYLFLAPVRREALIVGKFLAGALTTILILGTAVLSSFVLMYAHFEAGREFLASKEGLTHLGTYLLVTVLACLGYGAVILAFSLLFKNPIPASAILVLWEGVNGALPVWLKHVSVTFYLKPLFPVELPLRGLAGLFQVVAEPTPAWLAVSGLIAFTGIVVALACLRIRQVEVSYSSD